MHLLFFNLTFYLLHVNCGSKVLFFLLQIIKLNKYQIISNTKENIMFQTKWKKILTNDAKRRLLEMPERVFIKKVIRYWCLIFRILPRETILAGKCNAQSSHSHKDPDLGLDPALFLQYMDQTCHLPFERTHGNDKTSYQ